MMEIAKNHPDKEFIFLYLDGALQMASSMQKYISSQFFLNMKILTEASAQDYNELLEELISSKTDLSKYVFIYDTFKFLSTDINHKNANKKAMCTVKELTHLGATFISLGHTNKDKKNASGTAEIEQDSDAALRRDTMDKDSTKKIASIKIGGRCRFDVKEQSFDYIASDISSVEKSKIFTPILELEENNIIIQEIVSVLKIKPMIQKELENRLKYPHKRLIKILHNNAREGTWKLTKEDKNSHLYSYYELETKYR